MPLLIDMISPKQIFRVFCQAWYKQVSSFLRISHFMFGGDPYYEEESDDEDDVQIRYLTISTDSNSESDEQQDDEWQDISSESNNNEDDIFEAGGFTDIPQVQQRRSRYIRVPNHDSIEVIPGEKLLVWMNDSDPIFGRINETPEQVIQNWTKVYAPPYFYPRVLII